MKKINEIFYSLQGEGAFSGFPAVFVRFSGCNTHCDFCDTEHQSFTLMSDEEIVAAVSEYPANIVVITGGEPALQLTSELIDKLHAAGKRIHIETNGSIQLPSNIDFVTCSPKKNLEVVLSKIDELKVVYTGQELSQYDKYNADFYFLQPCSGKNTAEVIELVKLQPKWSLSVQLHKLLDIE